jgi:uncharacterized DUF497 family protein
MLRPGLSGCSLAGVSDAYDPAKDAANLAKHGLSLARAFDMDVAAFAVDDRFDYGEERIRAFGTIDGSIYCLVYTVRDGAMRPISLRRAHAKEMKRYVQA